MASPPKSPERTPAAARLSRDALIDAAIAIADAHGLEALTIRRLAKEVGVTPMAIYWHLADKEALLDALGERLFSEVRLPEPDGGAWDVQLAAVLTAILEALRRHPAVATLALPTVLASDAGLTVAERVLALLSEAGFDARGASDAGVYLLSSIVTLVAVQPDAAPADEAEARDRMMDAKRQRLARVSAERFPTVVALGDALLECDDTDGYYARGLDLLVTGIRGLAAV